MNNENLSPVELYLQDTEEKKNSEVSKHKMKRMDPPWMDILQQHIAQVRIRDR
jgi:hypothetical protein